jgi:hypothetical protein
MPIKDDLLLRTIEGLARTLAWLAGRVDDDMAATQVQEGLERIYREHLGVGGDTIRRLSSDQLVEVLSSTGDLEGDRAFVLAALLEVDAATPGTDVAERAGLRVRALDLYAEAGAVRVGQVDLPERVRRLRAALLEYQLPNATYARLLRYVAADDRLAEAEDLLFEWLEESGPCAEVIETGRAFYGRLLAASDAALERGDLPRDEVLEGQALFERSVTS